MPKIEKRFGLTRRTNFHHNDPMITDFSMFALIAPCRRVLRAWRVAVCPGAGVE